MKALIQRVSHASVKVDQTTVASIGKGILIFLGIEKADQQTVSTRLLHKVLNYRVFPDDSGHMNLSLLDAAGELLVVSQFTLAASTGKGLRPSFSSAMQPTEAVLLYEHFIDQARAHCKVSSGLFGADMQVDLCNDGPVTFLLSA
ncbi:MAG: D-tyrosyl-tRNA(Tyr) deacylase [Gammaproteobacteria bacterium]|mgnify:FL=1|jgi:D-aminoacyl-tRNA deacylase|nr:D-tyrosyl-tRNA(Tyr) deacylase [Gammaproteobacteria bacterium]MBT5205397.1 D-tyrosyl-tRNA(Tyr) deacylase [Gammaproteobacteria bacterium]MBT5604146.1 D-tyrosyl-tRNA(Tyr) deacylase [Gammaproteobacteria bacterium]MBT6245143.1 D-tyrosyl-tRNA(Tyr) deacylase [Gammaproteobacteria bacterium]